MALQHDPRPVRRRRVFYIPGYDPFPPRRYREMYRREGAEQAALSGYAVKMLPRGGGNRQGWRVRSEIAGQEVYSEHEVLVWSDIVQGSMGGSVLATYGQLLRTAWVYIASGALMRLVWLRKGPTVAALYPVGVLLAQLALALLAGWGLGLGVAAFGRWVLPGLPLLPAAAGWGAGLALIWGLLNWFRRQDNRIYAHYLMHDYAFTARWGGAYPQALEARMSHFADQLAAALHDHESGGWDEVLLVGHSSGAHLGVSILADLIAAGRVPPTGPALGFLTLGQVVPMVSFLPRAGRLRRDLAFLATRDELFWLDVTAPGDGCAFALCDPVAVTGVAPEGQRWPLIISAAFSQTLSPARWQKLKRRFFRLHFQYLCAFDNLPGRADDYDYFRITAGPERLGERYAARSHSPGRVTKPLNRFRDQRP